MINKWMNSLCVLAALALFCTLSIAKAATAKNPKLHYPIGKIALLEGNAYSYGKAGKKSLQEGDPIYFKGTIETGKDARLLVIFIDDTEITLGEDAKLIIDEYIFDPYDSSENKGKFSFTKGAFLWASGMISKKEIPDVRLETPQGSIGIRGTTVWGGNTSEGYGVLVQDGLVDYIGHWGQREIPAGNGVIIGSDQSASESKAWGKATITEAVQKISFSQYSASDIKNATRVIQKGNVQKRHDYRGQIFPYKENPYKPHLKKNKKDGFTEDFKQLQNK